MTTNNTVTQLKPYYWTPMGKIDQFPEGKKIKKHFNGRPIFILRQNGRFFAFEGHCPHVSESLEHATVDGHILTCQRHNMTFDLTNGAIVYDSGFLMIPALQVYQVKIENSEIFVA